VAVAVPAFAQGGSASDWEESYNDDGEFCCYISYVYNDNDDFVGYDFLFEQYDSYGAVDGYDEYSSVYEEVGDWTFLWYDWYELDADLNVLVHHEAMYTEDFELYEGSEPPSSGGGSTETPPTPTPGVVDLPPLFLTHPTSRTVTHEGSTYTLSLSTSDFVVVDDGGEEPRIDCTAAGKTAEIRTTPREWSLGAGPNSVQCTATDGGGKTSNISYTLTVDLISRAAALFASDGHEQRFDRIMRLHGPALSDDHIKKFIVYYHRAGAVVFDIGHSDGISGTPSNSVCGSGMSESQLLSRLRSGTDENKKHCLELLGESGAFRGVSLGF